jgi:hypothetical protein
MYNQQHWKKCWSPGPLALAPFAGHPVRVAVPPPVWMFDLGSFMSGVRGFNNPRAGCMLRAQLSVHSIPAWDNSVF